MDTNPANVEPPVIQSIKGNSTGESDGDYVKLKLRGDSTYSTSDIYEFRMSLFDHVEAEEFLLFVQNFQMTLADMETFETEAKIQYTRTHVRGEALRQFDLVSADSKNTETLLDVDYLVRGLAWFFPPVNSLSQQNRAIRRYMKNSRSLKGRRYAAHFIDLNEYLASFPGATMVDKMGGTELNEIPLNSIPNTCSKQACVQGFDCENISFKKDQHPNLCPSSHSSTPRIDSLYG